MRYSKWLMKLVEETDRRGYVRHGRIVAVHVAVMNDKGVLSKQPGWRYCGQGTANKDIMFILVMWPWVSINPR
jgi:hypothetical protein